MRHWERDLADHLVLLVLMHSDETLDEVVAELKNDLPSFPSEEAVRATYFGANSASRRQLDSGRRAKTP